MTSTVKGVVAFIFGGAIGAAAAWYATRSFYEKHLQEEIDSVKEAYGRKYGVSSSKEDSPKQSEVSESSKQDSIINREIDTHKVNYVEYANAVDAMDYGRDILFDPDSDVVAYIIDETEFGMKEDEGYHTISLVYYIDDILSDYQDDEIIGNVEGAIGTDWKKAFDKGEDIVYVRNDRRMCDYEILRSEKSYKDDILPTKAPSLES